MSLSSGLMRWSWSSLPMSICTQSISPMFSGGDAFIGGDHVVLDAQEVVAVFELALRSSSGTTLHLTASMSHSRCMSASFFEFSADWNCR
jgi:hypothetical protein